MGTNTSVDTPIIALAAEYNFMKDHTIEKMIAQTTLSHIAEIPHLTLEQAADLCNVSVSTYLRFCRSIGYASYRAFKVKMTDAIENYGYKNHVFSDHMPYDSANYFDQITDSIHSNMMQLRQTIDPGICQKLVQAFHEKDQIYIHDIRYSTIRLALQSDLALSGKTVIFSPNIDQQRKDTKEADNRSLFLLTYDMNTRSKEILCSIPIIKEKNAAIAVITPSAIFPGSELCDFILETGRGTSIISSLTMHDVIYQYLSLLYREQYI